MARGPTSLRRRLVTALTATVLGTLVVGGGAVADDGRGMSADDVGRASEPFHTRRGGGTGLGLSIAQAIVSGRGAGAGSRCG